jgi:hypothetical protein
VSPPSRQIGKHELKQYASDVDSFLLNASNTDAPVPPITLPTAAPAPSSARTLRGQSEKSFNTKTGKAKGKGVANPLDGTPSFFLDNDLVTYNHIGITAPTDEGAQKNRARTDQNEVKLANYIVTLERSINNNKNDANTHFAEMAKIMGEIKSSVTRSTIADDPSFVDVHNAVAENRKGIQNLINSVPSAETFQALQAVPAEVAALRANIEGLEARMVSSVVNAVKPAAVTVTPTGAGPSLIQAAVGTTLAVPTNAAPVADRLAFTPLTIPNNVSMGNP